MLNNKIILYIFCCLFFISSNSWSKDDLSLVIYQTNSFCRMVLYSDHCHDKNKYESTKRYSSKIKAEINTNTLSSVELLEKQGNLAWGNDAISLTVHGMPELRKKYLDEIKDSDASHNKNVVYLKSVVVGIAGCNSNKDKIEEFRKQLVADLIEKNFMIDKSSVSIVDCSDLIKQAGFEAIYSSSLDKNKYNNLLISLQSDNVINYKIFGNQEQEGFVANEQLSGGYSQLGRECKVFFEALSEPQDSQENNLISLKIANSQLSANLKTKKGEDLNQWLQKNHARDNARGLSIMKYILIKDKTQEVIEKEHVDENSADEKPIVIDDSLKDLLNTKIDLCIQYSIEQLDKLLDSKDFAIVLGEFISNKCIRKRYINMLNSQIDEIKRRNILVLTSCEFSKSLINAAIKISNHNKASAVKKYNDEINFPIYKYDAKKYFSLTKEEKECLKKNFLYSQSLFNMPILLNKLIFSELF